MTMTSYVVLRRNLQFADEEVEVQIGKVTFFSHLYEKLNWVEGYELSRGYPHRLFDVNLSLPLS